MSNAKIDQEIVSDLQAIAKSPKYSEEDKVKALALILGLTRIMAELNTIKPQEC